MTRSFDAVDTVIIGAGLTGLSMGRALLAAGRTILIAEASTAPGGLLTPKLIKGVPVDSYYHHLFVGDSRTLRLLAELDLDERLHWRAASVSLLDRDGLHRLTTPLDIVRFNGLSFGDKTRLALLIHRARSIPAEELDAVLARDWVLANAGEEVWDAFLRPLVEAKFGAATPHVSASWLASRIGVRSNRGVKGERLGFLEPGFHALISRLAEDLEPFLWCSEPVTGLIVQGERITGVSLGGRTVACRRAVFTGGANALSRLLGEEAHCIVPALSALRFQGILCGIFAIEGPARGAYWTNVMIPSAPFNVVVQQDLLEPVPGVHGLVYVSRYVEPSAASPADHDRVLDEFQEGLCAYLDVDPSTVSARVLAASDEAGIVYTTGTGATIKKLCASVEGLHLAGMLTSFPDRSIERSIAAAESIARDRSQVP